MKPILKWAGGKRHLASEIARHVPSAFNRYFEPFAGGAAMFFRLQPSHGILGDTNHELIQCYRTLRDDFKGVLSILEEWPNSEATYYEIRSLAPLDAATRAARMIYLTALSFNGIYRVNLKGQFNVPYGWKVNTVPATTIDLDSIGTLTSAELRVGDFELTTNDVSEGDFVYFDPPYTLAHNNNGFVKYNQCLFSWDDQVRLSKYAQDLASRGVHVIVSNADHCELDSLYCNFAKVSIARHSIIAAESHHRKQISESLYLGNIS